MIQWLLHLVIIHQIKSDPKNYIFTKIVQTLSQNLSALHNSDTDNSQQVLYGHTWIVMSQTEWLKAKWPDTPQSNDTIGINLGRARSEVSGLRCNRQRSPAVKKLVADADDEEPSKFSHIMCACKSCPLLLLKCVLDCIAELTFCLFLLMVLPQTTSNRIILWRLNYKMLALPTFAT